MKIGKNWARLGNLGPFYRTDKRRRKAVRLTFEGKFTDNKIAQSVQQH